MGIPFAIVGTSLSCKKDPKSWECIFMKIYDVSLIITFVYVIYILTKIKSKKTF